MTTSQGAGIEPTSAGTISSMPKEPKKLIKNPTGLGKKTWEEFRATGLLFFINQVLHAFGWAITIDLDDNNVITGAYPARLKERGFGEESVDRGYKKLANYLKDNAELLYEEIQ
jgi:hypothetical protein